MAPSYIVALASILVGAQSLIGLNLTSEDVTIFLMVLFAIFKAARQLWTGRSTLVGTRPKEFHESN